MEEFLDWEGCLEECLDYGGCSEDCWDFGGGLEECWDFGGCLKDCWRNGGKVFKVPVIVNKIFIIIGIGCGGSKDYTTKHIMIGLRLHVLMISLVRIRSGIWMKAKNHVWDEG